MPIDVVRARKETPGCENVLHFNNAGSALMPKPVIDAVNAHFLCEAQIGGYEAADLAQEEIQNFYLSVANLIHCMPQEIAYIENATRAWDMVFYALTFKPGDRILTTQAEYASNYIAFLQIAKKTGAVIDVIPNDEQGQLSLTALEKMIDSRVKLIAVIHVPMHSGLVNPVEAVGEIARKANVFYLLDATQSVGQMPVDVKKIQCDALCATGRKFLRGPRGTGFLFVRSEKIAQLEPPFLDLHAARWIEQNNYQIDKNALRFETWEKNYSNMIGLKKAIDYTSDWGMENIYERIRKLATLLRKKIASVPRVNVRDVGVNQCGIVTFTKEGLTQNMICQRLHEKNINVSTPLVEYARLDMEERKIIHLVRSSVHYYNTEDEVERFCTAVEAL